jgi:hypothetical protein
MQNIFFTCLTLLIGTSVLVAQGEGEWKAAVLAENEWRYRPGNSPPPQDWNAQSFDDSSWGEGSGGIGFGDGDDNTLITQTVSVCMRRSFEITDTSEITGIRLYADYDDGFVAYINGVEIARANLGVPGEVAAYDQLADSSHEAQMYQGGMPESFPLSLQNLSGVLKNGNNTLAVQVNNVSNTSSDLSAIFFLLLKVDGEVGPYQEVPEWFTMPFESSNLPLIFINTNGQVIPDEPKINAQMGIVDNAAGQRNYLSDPYNGYDGKIGIEIRGSSSQMFPKKNYSLETRLENGENNNVSLLGLPAENDWVLHGPYSDKSLMRNVLAYHISSITGQYAPRTRWCEVFINDNYQGVFVLTEKIKIDDNRVNIATLNPEDISGDQLTGGYIFSVERDNEGPGRGWSSPYTIDCFFRFQDPDHDELVPEQKDYIENYFNEFESLMISPSATEAYEAYIDVDSWVDYWISTEVYKHIDNYKFSFYMYKRKDSNGGKIHFGPQWDINLGFGNYDFGQDPGPEGWSYIWANLGFLRPFWVVNLSEIPEIQNRIKCRWLELRQGPLSTGSLMDFIDENNLMTLEARERNFQRWPILGQYVWPNSFVGEDYDSELNFLKQWLQERLQWMDENMPGFCSSLSTQHLQEKATELLVYPNPFSGLVNFKMQSIDLQQAEIQIFDVLGRERGRFILGNNQAVSFNPDKSAGNIFFYKLNIEGKTLKAGKFIRQIH